MSVESAPQTYAWKGRDFISGPDIYFNRARFYDQNMGRFISEDPLGYGAGDTNKYNFTWDNPKSWNDPTGLDAVEFAIMSKRGARVSVVESLGAVGTACTLNVINAAFDHSSEVGALVVDYAKCDTKLVQYKNDAEFAKLILEGQKSWYEGVQVFKALDKFVFGEGRQAAFDLKKANFNSKYFNIHILTGKVTTGLGISVSGSWCSTSPFIMILCNKLI